MKLYEKMREQKLLSTTLLVVTLSVGIVIGTLVNPGVHAARGQNVAPDATPLVVPRALEVGNEFTKLAKKLEPSVVNITAEYTPKAEVVQPGGRRGQPAPDEDDDSQDLFKHFFKGGPEDVPQQARRREQSGTGFIVDKNGYIITNKHVVSDEKGDIVDRIHVKLNGDTSEYRARVIGVDAETDLAVIKLDPRTPLTPVMIANSDSVQVGDWAIAIGSPFGLEETVTAGIVSATGRNNITGSQFQRFIQTDAAINPGNSGGPLLNIRGEVIGINTMIATQNGGSQGVGFALPVNMAVRVYNDIIRDGHVTRGSIGVKWDQQSSKPEILKALGVGHGVIIGEVFKGGPAEKAGVHGEDIIVGLNGQPVKDGDDLVARVADVPVGSPVTLNVDRDGKKMDFSLTIQNRAQLYKDDPSYNGTRIPTEEPVKPETTASRQVKFGISGRPVDEEERTLTPDKRGVTITYIEPGSFAEEIGMEDRDIIIAINRQPVTSVDDIRKVQQTLKPGDPVAFRVVRKNAGRGRRAVGTGVNATTMFLSGSLPQN
jgi:serine protease Do